MVYTSDSPAMQRMQIDLSEAERNGLKVLSLRSGRSQSGLIRTTIDTFLQQHEPQYRLTRLSQARRLWAARTDLPDWQALRQELDRHPLRD